MNSRWQLRKIGDVCDLATGGTPSRSKPEFFGGDIKWLVSGDINQGEIFDCEGRITQEGMMHSNTKILPLNSVMIALNGQGKTRGTVALLRTKATCNQSLVNICPKDASVLLPEFLYANLQGRYDEIRKLTSDDDNDRRGLNMGIVRNIKIPIAPIEEQQRIVNLLDEAFAALATAKANIEKNLQNAHTLAGRYSEDLFRNLFKQGVHKPLGTVCDLLNGFAFESADAVESSQTQLLRIGNLYESRLDLERRAVFYPDEFATTYQRYLLNKGDIIMSLTGTKGKEDYGYAVKINKLKHNLLMNQRVAKFIVIRKDLLDQDFLLQYLRSRTFLDILYPTANGTRQGNLSSGTIKSLPIPLGSLSAQKKIASHVELMEQEVHRLKSFYQQKLTALDALKKSLLHHAFTGQLKSEMLELEVIAS